MPPSTTTDRTFGATTEHTARRGSVPVALALLGALALGCEPDPLPRPPSVGSGSAAPGSAGPTGASSASALPIVPVTRNVFPSPKRLVAFGDVHGDLDAGKRALRLAGAIDDAGHWAGGDLFVVQVGDQLDRGDDDRALLDLFEALRAEAKQAGGTFLALNGNHEIMNASLDFRYATPASLAAFDELAKDGPSGLSKLPAEQRGRAAALLPGGPYAQRLAQQPVFAVVGDSVFVHGGILPKHLAYGLDKIDTETRDWLLGKAPRAPEILVAEDGPVWTRLYSEQVGPAECQTLASVLGALGKKRLVMGHTPQKPGISLACNGQAVRVDTGMSRYYHGAVEVLEITDGEPKVLKER